MKSRHLFLISCTVAIVIQAAFIIGYYIVTDGCFCAILSSGEASPQPRAVLWFLNSADIVHHLGIRSQVGDLPSTLLSAALNFIAWTGVLFLALSGISLLLRHWHLTSRA